MNIAVIIARKNSKRLKKKNFYKIGNKNLIQRAVVSAIDSKIFHKIIINSDIADISKAFKFLDKKKITPLIKNNPLLKKETRTQDIQTTYRPNGAFYISKVKTILKNKNFFQGKLAGFVMPKNRSIDIDTFEDLQLARFYYKNTKK